MLRVLIAASTRFYADGLASLLDRDADFDVVGVVRSDDDLLAEAAAGEPDVVLVDLGLCSAIESIRRLDAHVVVLAISEQEHDIVACAEAGAAGFVTRDSSFQDLADAVRSAARGELLCSPTIAATLLRRVGVLANAAPAPAQATEALTAREREIVGLIDEGLSNKQIGVRLSIEVATVKNHVHNILEKLNVSRRGEAAAQIRREI